jgi:drug/metabolite transporter (DMT)-like permease
LTGPFIGVIFGKYPLNCTQIERTVKNWLMFGLLGLIWGASFLLIKVGLTGLDPFSLVAGRLTTAAIAFVVFIFITRRKIPNDRALLAKIALVGITNTAIPFLLITWGENTIDSGLAGVLDATAPLFSLIIAHWALEDDKISLGKILGLITGFAGVVILAMRGADPNHANPIAGQLAVIVASVFYGGSAVYIRRYLRGADTVILPGGSLVSGALLVLLMTVLTVRPLPNPAVLELKVIGAVIVLGIVNTFIAYLLYFALIQNWGASRATTVGYVLPPVSVFLGAIFNGEPIDFQIILGTILIVGGVALANLLGPKRSPEAAPVIPEITPTSEQ